MSEEANPLRVTFVGASGLPVAAGGAPDLIYIPPKVSFTRPANATAYSIGDLIANDTAAGSFVPLSWTGATISGDGGKGYIAGLAIGKSDSAQTLVRAHFFKTTAPTVSNGDNGALAVSNFDLDKYIGPVDVALDSGVNGGAAGYGSCFLDYVIDAGDTIYAVLEARAAFTPGNAGAWRVRPRFRRFS